MDDYLNDLNAAQRKAVEKTEGPLMVVAGAGSGKTRVLTYRVVHLLKKGIPAQHILSLTFTNKAAREMKERIGRVIGNNAHKLWMGTFHSVFSKILRVEADKLGYPSNFTIYDTDDSKSLLRLIIKERHLNKDVYKPNALYTRISQLKNNLVTVNSYYTNGELQAQDNTMKRPLFGEVYQEYCERCLQSGAMDFDDLLLKTNELLQRFPKVLEKYQNRFQYILVDEYQDTNHSQYLIIKSLAAKHQNICVVGDDAQSIYAFRGANIRNILDFQRDYEGVQSFKLEQNYRSSKVIVNAANSIIKHNKDRIQKEVFTKNNTGERIRVFRTPSDREEGTLVAAGIFDRMQRNQQSLRNFAVLYRTNAQSRAIEDALRRRNLPYEVYGGQSFYQRKEVKDLLAYFRLTINPNDEESFRRSINYPPRGIGATSISRLSKTARQQNITLWEVAQNLDTYPTNINVGGQIKISGFANLINQFSEKASKGDAYEVATHITKATGIVQSFEQENSPESLSRLDNIEELINSIKGFCESAKDDAEKKSTLAEFMQEVALLTDSDTKDENPNKVTLMTIHQAKGLEFPHLFIVGLEEQLFPSRMALEKPADLEEERRLFYVALTRAEETATLTYASSRFKWGTLIDCKPSRFIGEIDEQYVDLQFPTFKKQLNFSSKRKTSYKKTYPTPTHPSSITKKTMEETKKKGLIPTNLKHLNTETTPGAIGSANVKLSAGQKVKHKRFGSGTVATLEGHGANQKVVVDFSNTGRKTLLIKFAKLQVIG